MKKVTIKDIAKMADVSTTTVSMVINNKANHISQDTIVRVMKVIKDTNYIPNGFARSMVTKKSHLIGLIIPDITNPYFAEMARHIEMEANAKGYNVILCNSDDEIENELKYIRLLKEKNIDGLILVSASLSLHSEVKELEANNIPVVILDRVKQYEKEHIIIFDNRKAGYMATDYLISQGHEHIACLIGPLGNDSTQERLLGHKKALLTHNYRANTERVFEGDYKVEGGYKAMKEILKTDATAVFVFNDYMAIGAYKAIYEANLSVPEDISIIGIDNLYLSSIINPQLTTIEQPAALMGEAAVKMLHQVIKGHDSYDKKACFDPKLIVRDSVKLIRE